MRGGRSPAYMTSDTLETWRESTETLEQIAGYRQRSFTLTGEGDPVRLRGIAASPDLFSLLRVTPALGRLFLPNEDRPGTDRVVVLSDSLWQRQFRGDADILGASVVLDDVPHTIVGVLPPRFAFPEPDTEIYTPLTLTTPTLQPGRVMIVAFSGIARLAPGVAIDTAIAEGQTVVHRIHSERGGPMA